MSKTIKVEDRVYDRLEEIREKRETFSEAVERLLKVYDTIKTVSDTLGPSHYLKDFKHGPEKIQELQVR